MRVQHQAEHDRVGLEELPRVVDQEADTRCGVDGFGEDQDQPGDADRVPQADQAVRHRGRQHHVAGPARTGSGRASGRPRSAPDRCRGCRRTGSGRAGRRRPSAIRISLGSSPMPNQMISSGIRPTTGTVRSIWIGASMMSSPTLNRPEISAAITAAVSPKKQPESDPLRGGQDRLLQFAGADQFAGLGDDVLRRGQGVPGQPPGLAGDVPEQQQRQRADRLDSPAGQLAPAGALGSGRRWWSSARTVPGGRRRGLPAPRVRSAQPTAAGRAAVPCCAPSRVSRQRTRPRSSSGPR